jgi:4-hydroxybenzoate polyprenyltransferase
MTERNVDVRTAVVPAVSFPRAVIKALRPHQWAKNVLVVVPLITSHEITHPAKVMVASIAFLAFCLCASGVYVVNDLLDRESDRLHPTKRNRPFASGALSSRAGVLMAIVLPLMALAVSLATQSIQFIAMLGAYYIVSSLYSLWIKHKLLLDVIVLAGLYTHRIIAGAVVISVVLSPWLLAFSMFLFLSLAFVKRYTELTLLQDVAGPETTRRNYGAGDLSMIESVGPIGGYMAVMVLALYINSDQVRTLYRTPGLLWLLCPLLLYWITRIWFFAKRHALEDDPISFALRDRVSLICGVVGFAVVVLAWTVHV